MLCLTDKFLAKSSVCKISSPYYLLSFTFSMSTDTSANNKRIAKNTLFLYTRTFLTMLVTLYTSRVVLNVLGVEDYGLYNIVGGVTAMLAFINSSLSGATSRFITFELGKGTRDDVEKVFRCAVSIHYILAVILFVFAETVGLWFVSTQLVIPPDRLIASIWVYQCAIISFFISIISAPYNALIIAHERMNAFAYISIFDVTAKLLVVYLLDICSTDKLITYSILMLVVQVLVRLLYTNYCKKHFSESNSRWLWDKTLSRKIFAYAGWTLNGNLAVVGYTQGINILLNIFFGPAVNAARAIAVQVQTAVTMFYTNFQMAARPQILKSYAVKDLRYMHKLVLMSTRFSFYLTLLLIQPIFINAQYILNLWLEHVPEHTVAFTQLMILTCLICSLNGPTIISAHATGNLKKFQLVESSILLLVVPVSYLLLKFAHISAEMVFVIYFVIEVITQFARVAVVFPQIGLAKSQFLINVLWPIIKVILVVIPFDYLLYHNQTVNFAEFVINSILCVISTLAVIYILGINQNERRMILDKCKYYFTRK